MAAVLRCRHLCLLFCGPVHTLGQGGYIFYAGGSLAGAGYCHLTTPTVAGLPGLCENFRPTTSKSSPIWRLLSSHWATSVVRRRVVGVCVWLVCEYSRFQWRQHVTDDAATYYAEQGLCNGRVSICLSHRSTASASGFAAELPAGAAYQLWTIDICCRRLHSAGNVDSVMLRADGWGWTQTCCHWVHSL